MTEAEGGRSTLLERLRDVSSRGDGDERDCQEVDEISCREAVERVYEYLDDELGEGKAEEIRCHVETCKRCYPMYNWERLFLGVIRESVDRPESNSRLRRKVEHLLERERRA